MADGSIAAAGPPTDANSKMIGTTLRGIVPIP
jgi:hypothetical protein